MKRFTIGAVLFRLVLTGLSFAQSGAVIPQGGAGHATQATCVILKRMGPADEVTSHLYSFGLRGKQFQYVEGKLPDGFPFHGRLTDHDVRNLQGRGAEVIVLNQNFTSEELKQARSDCRGETGATPNQADEKGTPSQPSGGSSIAIPAPEPKPGANFQIASTPPGADIELDGSFVGNTPSDVEVSQGEHMLKISKNGFTPWEKKIKASGGNININAELEAQPK